MLLSPYISHSSILAWRIPWTEEPGGVVQKVTESDTTQVSKQQQQQGAWEMCLAQGHTHAKSRIQTMFSQLYMLRCSKYFFKGSLLAALGLSINNKYVLKLWETYMKDLNAFQTMLDAKDVKINRKQDLPLIISSIQYMKFNQLHIENEQGFSASYFFLL